MPTMHQILLGFKDTALNKVYKSTALMDLILQKPR